MFAGWWASLLNLLGMGAGTPSAPASANLRYVTLPGVDRSAVSLAGADRSAVTLPGSAEG